MEQKVQTVVTLRGDRLLDLVRRVYQIRDQDRVLAAAMAVTAHTPQNNMQLNNRFNQPLEAGISIDFPPWPIIEQQIRKNDARKQQLTQQVAVKAAPPRAAAIAPLTRQVSISRQTPLGERTITKEMLRALGLSATEAINDLKPLQAEELDPSRTRSPAVAKISEYGKTIADSCPRQALSELFQQSEKGFMQSWELLVRQGNPRAFPPNVDAGPTIMTLLSGFMMAFSQRLTREAKDEIARRHRLLGRVLARSEARDKTANAGAGSRAFAGVQGARLVQLLEQATQAEAPDQPSAGVLDQLKRQYGLLGSAQETRLFFPTAQNPQPYLAFLDQFHSGGNDGPIAQTLLELATRVSDAHKNAVNNATAWLEGQSIDGKIGPNEALAKVLNEVLKRMRTSRAALPPEAQNRQLADERHLLSGRNYLTFRKDVCLGLDKRLTLAGQLTPEQRVSVLLALLIQDGHRLTTLRPEEIDAACDRFVQASTL